MSELNADQLSEVTFLSGVDANGILAPTSFWTWDRNAPATYSQNNQSKFGDASAGTGATITYDFAAISHWTETEKAAFRSSMALWSAIADVTFSEVSIGGQVVILRGSDGTASGGATNYYPGRIGSRTLGQSIDGSIQIDTGVAGFGPIGAALTAAGGYPWTTMVHELGHILGLGHGGPYNDGDTTDDPQFTSADSLRYTIMSYNGETTDWGGTSDYNYQFYYPTTPMLLDIAAAQRLYGRPVNTPLSGGQVFGYNSNVGGDLGKFYDFTVNVKPVVTLWDAGENNTLDMSGSSGTSVVNLTPGAASSVMGFNANLTIAYDTHIDRYIGGNGGNTVLANDFGDTLVGGAADDMLTGGAGNDILIGRTGNDRIDGGGGTDALVRASLLRRTATSFYAGSGSLDDAGSGRDFDLFSGIETVVFQDGYLTDNPDDNALRILRLYDALLGRGPNQADLDYWVHQMAGGEGLVWVAVDFLASPEFAARAGAQSDADYIDYLYRNALGRTPSDVDRAYWIDQLPRSNRPEVALGFSESPEARARTTAMLDNGLFVDDRGAQEIAALYDAFADRRPDAAGFTYWDIVYASGQKTVAQIADDFAQSPEFAQHIAGFDTAQIIDYLYRTALNRPAGADGISYWEGQIADGLTRGGLLYDIAVSPEHFAIIAADITGGIATTG